MSRIVMTAVTASLLTGSPAPAQTDALPSRAVPAHEVPAPQAVSPELRKRIAVPDPAKPAVFPTTNEGWRSYANPDPKATDEKVAALLQELGLTIAEKNFGGVPAFEIAPRAVQEPNRHRLLVHLHGGAYVIGAGNSGITEAILVAGASGIRTISIDYRMPPEHPFPAPMDDATSAWRAIAAANPREKIGLFGSSAGGAMALALVQRAQREKLPLPIAVIAGTPWSDLSETGDSYFTNRYHDPVRYDQVLKVAARQYAGSLDLKDPRLSPVYGSFANFPPVMLISGTRDLFLSNTIRVDRKIRDAGGESELIVYEGQSHARYLSGLDVPETLTALSDMTRFWQRHM